MSTTNDFCGVCGEFDTCVYATMPGTAIAVAYCPDCSLVGAQPFDLLALQVAKAGGFDAMVSGDAVDLLPTTYDTLERLDRTMEEFEAAVTHCAAFIEMNDLQEVEGN